MLFQSIRRPQFLLTGVGLLFLVWGPLWDSPGMAQTTSQAQHVELRDVTSKLLCPCGCSSMLLSSCFCGTSQSLQAQIQQQIDAGQSAEQITAGLIAQYGPEMWAAPPAEGFNLVAWIAPSIIMLVLFLVFAWVIKLFLARRHGEVREPQTSSGASSDYLKQVEEELEAYKDRG